MSRFTGPLVIEEVKPGRRWRLRDDIVFEVFAEGSGKVIRVPAGFETDGASIPPVLQAVLAVWGTYGRAACLHDYLYSIIRSGELIQPVPDGSGCEEPHPAFAEAWGDRLWPLDECGAARAFADEVFLDAMRACGTAGWLSWLIWLAVRLFGRRAVRGDR